MDTYRSFFGRMVLWLSKASGFVDDHFISGRCVTYLQ